MKECGGAEIRGFPADVKRDMRGTMIGTSGRWFEQGTLAFGRLPATCWYSLTCALMMVLRGMVYNGNT